MPSSESAGAGPSSKLAGAQPYQCVICAKRFTRHENLRRHAVIHTSTTNGTSFPCPHCSTSLSRPDLRRRHIKKKHPEVVSERRPSSNGTAPEGVEEAMEEDSPASVDRAEISPAAGGSGMFDYSSGGSFEPGPSNPHQTDIDKLFELSDISTGFTPRGLVLEEFSMTSGLGGETFHPPEETFHPPLNFARSASFEQTSPRIPSPSTRNPANLPGQGSHTSPFGLPRTDLGHSAPGPPLRPPHTHTPLLDPATVILGVDLFFAHVSPYCSFIHQPTFDSSTAPDVLLLAMLSVSMQFGADVDEGKRFGKRCCDQARRLLEDMDEAGCSPAINLQVLQACLLLQLCAIMMIGGPETKHGLRLHAKCIEPDTAGDLDALWAQFARAESHKRVYQLDATWYQVLSTPRHMSHLEIKHEMPCSDQLWSAPSATAWAHRTLVERSKPLPKYLAAIRNCLTPSPETDHILDSYGSILVIFFLLSSVREVSGWSTMTGRVCFERFEALHASLKSLEPRVCGKQGSAMDLFTEAMWHTAMMDLLLWSPAHTQGVVEYSMDAAIAAAIHFGISQPIGISVESLNPHLEWFLSYLNTTPHPHLEPPWMTLYAFKAALVAWQLVRSGSLEPVRGLGVVDAKGMCAWIKRCFENRRNWGIGRLVLNNMDDLETASL